MSYNISNDTINNVFDSTVCLIAMCCFGGTKNEWDMNYLDLFEKEFEVLKASFKLFINGLCDHKIIFNGNMIFGWLFEELRQAFGLIADAPLLIYVSCIVADSLLNKTGSVM